MEAAAKPKIPLFDFADKPIANRAYNLALTYHEGQTRKYTGDPYVIHPCEVTRILLNYGEYDQELLATALLHDVLEDTHCLPKTIEGNCGKRVLRFVQALTKPTGISKRRREEVYLEQLRQANPIAQKVKLADIAHNLSDVAHHDPEYAARYVEKKAVQVEALKHPDWPVWQQAKAAVRDCRNQVALYILEQQKEIESRRRADATELEDAVLADLAQEEITDFALF